MADNNDEAAANSKDTEPSDKRTQIDECPEQLGGPLTPAADKKLTGKDNKHRIHYYTEQGKSVGGCDVNYNPTNINAITCKEDWQDLIPKDNSRICAFCDRRAKPPSTWTEVATPEEDLDSNTDNSSSTDSNNDTDSDDDAIQLKDA